MNESMNECVKDDVEAWRVLQKGSVMYHCIMVGRW